MQGQAVVLVVEDELFIRMATVEALVDAGFEVLEAVTASEAIAMLEQCPHIRIVFTDIDLADEVDGLTLLQMIANRWPPILLFATSGAVVPRDDQLPAGAQFLPKPYYPDSLITAFSTALHS